MAQMEAETIVTIRDDEEHADALRRIEELFDVPEGDELSDELETLVSLVEDYESKHYPIDPPDPISAAAFRREQEGPTDG